ncbi:class I SAM-dependent methyltransferase [Spiribacter sp. 218]|uniref:class I SAM-dependent methyltransferase n=1 Tax=Spiribacter pallidus TaxID=1987936 RepID=UPI00349FCC98
MNRVFEYLAGIGMCTEDALVEEWPRVRNAEQVKVYKCKKSGVIFLDTILSAGAEEFEGKSGYGFYGQISRDEMERQYHYDNLQRRRKYGPLVKNKNWIDIGAGSGATLNCLSDIAKSSMAVEPKKGARANLVGQGYTAYASIKDAVAECEGAVDVVSLIQTLPYIDEPIEELERTRNLLTPGGRIFIEVPHANDALLSFYNLDAFRDFTYHSELLILHTRQSLKKTLEVAGFEGVVVEGVQRYPLSNHLYWLANGRPGGHEEWTVMDSQELESSYAERLKAMNMTDTLVAYARA